MRSESRVLAREWPQQASGIKYDRCLCLTWKGYLTVKTGTSNASFGEASPCTTTASVFQGSDDRDKDRLGRGASVADIEVFIGEWVEEGDILQKVLKVRLSGDRRTT